MHTFPSRLQCQVLSVFALFAPMALFSNYSDAKDFNPDNRLNPPAPVYWCPGKLPDQQIATRKSAGCQPLYDPQVEKAFRQNIRQGMKLPEREPIKTQELLNAAFQFADRYRTFLSCCATDVAASDQIVELIDEATHILKSIQQKGMFNSAGFGVEIVGTVARGRDDLLALKQRLEQLHAAQQNLGFADYESSGRARLQMQEDEEAIRKDFLSRKPPASTPTGKEIQDKTFRSRIGGDIEDTTLTPNFGADIGYAVSPYSNVGESLRPRRGEAIHDSQLPYRPGMEGQDTTIPKSTGFQIDQAQNPDGASTVQRRGAGPSIGDSELNGRRR